MYGKGLHKQYTSLITWTLHFLQERKTSVTYDYARDEESRFSFRLASPVFSEGHYEFDTNMEPFWEPASAEDELKNQLQCIALSEDNIM